MELTIISEETVAVLDRHVFKGAGKLTIRLLFAAVCVFALNEVWEFAPKVGHAILWLNNPKNWTTVHAVSVGVFFKTIVSILVMAFMVMSGMQMVTMAMNVIAWTWRKPRYATQHMVLAWRETSGVKRVGFVALMTWSVLLLIVMYVFAILYIIHFFA